MENIISLKDVSKTYQDFKLENVSFNVPTGSIVGFIGENGAGKTTTIKIILDIIEKEGGDISVLGENYKDVSRDNIGIALDTCCLPETLTLTDINLIMKNIYKVWNSSKFFDLANKMNIPKNKRILEMSKGTQMKLSIIAALTHNPKLLVLDEATSGLDPVVREEILEMFLDFMQNEEHGILMSSHILSDLEKICDYIVFIHKGEIIFSEEKDILKEKYGILKCSTEELKTIKEEAIVKVRKNTFGVEALVIKEYISKGFILDKPTIEEIMLYHIK